MVLGLLASQPAGQVLEGFHSDLESGNLAGLMSRFSVSARLGQLRGTSELADYYRELFERHPQRSVDLEVLRMQRGDPQLTVEARLAMRAGDAVISEDRVRFVLAAKRGTLKIEAIGY